MFPQYLEIQTQTLCNAHCSICPYTGVENEVYEGKNLIMPMETITKIINEAANYKQYVKRVIPYLNNEPTLDKRLVDILRLIKSKGFFVELSTNGVGLNQKLSFEIINEKLVDNLRISFFGGTKETYNSTMTRMDFGTSYKRIKNFCDLNNAKEKPIDLEIVYVLNPKDNAEYETRNLKELFPEENIHLFGYLDRAGNNKEKNKTIYQDCLTGTFTLNGCSLHRPDERVCIVNNGDVVLCSQDWRRQIIVGNVNDTSLFNIWNGESFEKVRQKVHGKIRAEKDFLCHSCKLINLKVGETTQLNFKGDKYMGSDGEKKISVKKGGTLI